MDREEVEKKARRVSVENLMKKVCRTILEEFGKEEEPPAKENENKESKKE